MAQKARESKKSNDNRPVQVITSPEGVKIQITAGNKWKFTRAVHRAGKKQYSELQKQIMTILIDLTNEGYGPDLSKWGWAYPSFVKLAAECGCTPEAAKSNIKKLEAKGVLTVKRSAGKRASERREKAAAADATRPICTGCMVGTNLGVLKTVKPKR